MPAPKPGDAQSELGGRPISGMPDGKDFHINRFNRNPLLRRLAYSNKSSGPALIIIAWATTTGQIVLVTDVFFARVSESSLVQLYEPWLRIFGMNTYIVADKGFVSTQSCYPNGNPLVCPATKGCGVDLYQYSASLLKASRDESALRWAVEAAFSRAWLDRWTHAPTRRSILHMAEDLIFISLTNTLWHRPFAQPADWNSVNSSIQSKYKNPTRVHNKGPAKDVAPTNLFEYFAAKMFPDPVA